MNDTTMEQRPDNPYDDLYAGSSAVEVAKAMASVAEEIRIIDDHRKNRVAEYDAIRKRILPDRMEDEGLASMNVMGTGRISLRTDVYANIPAPTRENAFNWLRGMGHGGMIKETVHSGTLKALMKSILRDGGDLPPEDVIKVQPYSMAVLTRTKTN